MAHDIITTGRNSVKFKIVAQKSNFKYLCPTCNTIQQCNIVYIELLDSKEKKPSELMLNRNELYIPQLYSTGMNEFIFESQAIHICDLCYKNINNVINSLKISSLKLKN